MTQPYCPACPGFGVLLGSLGTTRWYRCRDCGVTFRRTRKPRARRVTKL